MMYATSDSGGRVLATPGSSAACPVCREPVLAKCGEINAWHWAHHARMDCDPWSEGETAWHLAWKARVCPARCEITIGGHRADIVGHGGVVIELQHSPLAPAKVREREAFYGDMLWILDASEFRENLTLRPYKDHHTFTWKRPRKWTFSVGKPLYFDLRDDGLFHVRKLYPNEPAGVRFTGRVVTRPDGTSVPVGVPVAPRRCAGWGVFVPTEQFFERHRLGELPAKFQGGLFA